MSQSKIRIDLYQNVNLYRCLKNENVKKPDIFEGVMKFKIM